MRRRDLIKLAGGAIAGLPSVARAQARKHPTIGVLWHAGSAGEEGEYYQ
jgi:putative ABC transport system substrate-binding protein